MRVAFLIAWILDIASTASTSAARARINNSRASPAACPNLARCSNGQGRALRAALRADLDSFLRAVRCELVRPGREDAFPAEQEDEAAGSPEHCHTPIGRSCIRIMNGRESGTTADDFARFGVDPSNPIWAASAGFSHIGMTKDAARSGLCARICTNQPTASCPLQSTRRVRSTPAANETPHRLFRQQIGLASAETIVGLAPAALKQASITW